MNLVALVRDIDLSRSERGAVTSRLAASVALVAASASAGVVGSGAIAHAEADEIKICHATGSSNNPYIVQTPAKDGDVAGHAGHVGPIWTEGTTTWGDIIPPFDDFPGLNWATGQAVWENRCNALPGVTNRPPVAVDDTDDATTGGADVPIDVLANDSDDDGDALTVTAVDQTGTVGSVVFTTSGVTYAPPEISDSTPTSTTFTYTITDGTATDTATVTVRLTDGTPANRAPVAVDDVHAATTGGPAALLTVLANDSDPDGDDITVVAVDPTGTLGGVAIAGDGSTVRYAPPAIGSTDAATDTFTYTVTDGVLQSEPATVTVTLTAGTPGNRPPVAVDDHAETAYGVPVLLSVLGNDSDPDGDPLVIDGITGPEHGAVAPGDHVSGAGSLRVSDVQGSVASADGVLTYVPAEGFSGTDTFTYLVSDGRGGTDSALVTVEVGSAPEASPTASPAAGPTASPIGGVTSAEPATGSPTPAPTAVASASATASPSPTGTAATAGPTASAAPASGGAAAPTALPFTGGSTDLLLGLGAALSVLGLLLALTGRRRRTTA